MTPMIDVDRVTVLEGLVAQLLTRVKALELATRPTPRTGLFIDDERESAP